MIYDDALTVKQALQIYYRENSLPADGGVTDKWARYKLFGKTMIAFPNFTHRVHALKRHDLHHIINNIDTSNKGEGLIAAWELGAGCGPYWISWFMESQALWWGILYARKESLQLFEVGRNSKSFFTEPITDEINEQTVGSVRKRMLPTSAKVQTLNENLQRIRLTTYLKLTACLALGALSGLVFIPLVLIFAPMSFFKQTDLNENPGTK